MRTLPNVLALPHLGYATKRNHGRYFGEVVEDIEAFLAGGTGAGTGLSRASPTRQDERAHPGGTKLAMSSDQ
nr:hypothetical protein [Streptomyces sp. MB09-01]